jgi:hypothetical protein
MNKKNWGTKSLEWIHDVRETIDRDIIEKGRSPGEWVKARKGLDVGVLCKKLGLKNFTVIKAPTKVY